MLSGNCKRNKLYNIMKKIRGKSSANVSCWQISKCFVNYSYRLVQKRIIELSVSLKIEIPKL